MRLSSLVFVTALLLLSSGAFAQAQSGANTFTENLSFGSRSAQIIALQKILNTDPATRIADVGPGSLGYETTYFGSLTKAAVVRFQAKYASEVLAPVSLTRGNGFVGSYTRAKLNALSATVATSGNVNPPVMPLVITPPVASIPTPATISPTPTPVIETTPQNPNLKNLDKFMFAIDSVAAKRGYSAANVAAFKQAVMEDIATTTDLRATFLKIVQKSSPQAQNTSFGGRIVALAEQLFGKVFLPERARAATGVPFGGALLFSYFCYCSANWLLTIEPLPPSYAAELSYEPFSQAFLSYNIPFTTWLLGEYVPGAGVCSTGPYCAATFPSEGMISPMTGSSPL